MVSVVIAAWNEAPSIGRVVAGALDALTERDEVLVVDDGSTDDTSEAARSAGATVVRMGSNRGKGEALRAGIVEAAGDVLLFIDADGQDDPSEIPILLNALTPDTDMVIGSRFEGRLLEGSITGMNRVGNRVLTAVFNILYGTRISDTQAGFRVVRRSGLEVEKLKAVRYEIETELTMHVVRKGGRIREVPVTRAKRDHGESGFARLRDGTRILARMIAGRFGR